MTNEESPRYRYLRDEERRAWLTSLRMAVAPILANNLLPHFTDHSVRHSDSLTRLVDELIQPLQCPAGDQALNSDELFVLYAACYLHDIGMQYERAGESRAVQERMRERGLTVPWEELEEATKRELLRDCHPRISAEMVAASVRSALPPIGFQLSDEQQPEYIARLCEAHGVEAPSERYDLLTRDGPQLRMKLLSALLRLADILDESQHRALLPRARTLDLDLVAQTHWWRHYYVEGVVFDPTQRTVTLHFDFPPDRHDEYARIVPELQVPVIREEFGRHEAVLNQYNCGWTVQRRIQEGPYGTADAMPDTVAIAMLQQLQFRREQQAERERLAVFAALDETQVLIRRRLQVLDAQSDISPETRLREIHGIARESGQLGARRSAWMLLSGEYQQSASGLPPAERLQVGCDLAEMMLQDDEAPLAAQVLQELRPLADAPAMRTEERRAFWQLWAHCVSACGAYQEAIRAFESLMELSADPAERAELQATLAEEHLLHGALDRARHVAEGQEESA